MILTETERLIIRQVHLLDLEPLRGVFEDPDVMHYGPGIQTLEAQQKWLHDALLNYQQ